MRNKTRQRLLDALGSCRAVARYTAGLDFAGYKSDDILRDAGERRPGIIGEALSRAEDLEPDLIEQIPELRQIIGLRNRLIHGYDAVADVIVWATVQDELPPLAARLAIVLGEDDPG